MYRSACFASCLMETDKFISLKPVGVLYLTGGFEDCAQPIAQGVVVTSRRIRSFQNIFNSGLWLPLTGICCLCLQRTPWFTVGPKLSRSLLSRRRCLHWVSQPHGFNCAGSPIANRHISRASDFRGVPNSPLHNTN